MLCQSSFTNLAQVGSRLDLASYKYSSKLLYEITVFMVRVKVRKTKSLKLSSAAARP